MTYEGTERRKHERDEICIEKFKQMDEHIKDSVPFREAVTKHNEQVLALERAHMVMVQDVKEIKEAIARLERTVMYAAIAGLMTLVGIALWLGGDKRQIEVNTARLDKIEQEHHEGIK
jgi:hypothetical protein